MDATAAPSAVPARLASHQARADGPATALLVQSDQDSSVIGERNSARASGETPGGESPGSVSPAQGLRGWTD
jgi:hypothetical protein